MTAIKQLNRILCLSSGRSKSMKLMHLTAQSVCEALVLMLKLKFSVSRRKIRSPSEDVVLGFAVVYHLEGRRPPCLPSAGPELWVPRKCPGVRWPNRAVSKLYREDLSGKLIKIGCFTGFPHRTGRGYGQRLLEKRPVPQPPSFEIKAPVQRLSGCMHGLGLGQAARDPRREGQCTAWPSSPPPR